MNLLETFIISCKQATYLHTKKSEDKLSFAEKTGLNLHLLFCSICRLFFTQIDELEKHAHNCSHTDRVNATLDTAIKEKMQLALADEMKK
jgi:hypothetical protein